MHHSKAGGQGYRNARRKVLGAATPVKSRHNLLGLLLGMSTLGLGLGGARASDPPGGAGNSAVSVDPPPAAGYQLPAVAAPGSAGDTERSNPIHVERIVFRGNKALRSSALQVVAAPYLGHDLGAADVEELRDALTHQYTDRGYINSGVVVDPNAPYHDGVLSFQVIEGHIKTVRVRGLKGLRSGYVVDRLRGASDETLNTNELRERFQRLLDDPLFARINSRIEPGAELGEAILDVDVVRARPYSLSLALNNYRPPSIGEKAYDLAGQVRDLTGWGDEVDADITGPIEFSGGIGYSLGWQLPVNRYGTQVSVSASRSQTVITEEPLAALDIRSTIDRQEFRVTQPLAGTLTQQFNIGAAIAHERDATLLAGQEFSFLPGASQGVTRSITARLIPDYSYRSEHQYLGVRITILHADLLDQPSGPVAYAQPNSSYFVETAQLHHLWEFSPLPFELESRATVQRTDAQISDLHALEIGGINSVRGFRENEILLSNVRNVNVDFRWLALPTGNSLRPGVTLGTFFDWADGYNVDGPTSTFSSTGVTLRMKWLHVQADLAYGIPIIQPGFVSGQHGTWQDHGLHAQILTTL